MRFLLDQDVFVITMKFLRDLGHDVVPVAQLGLSQADDSILLKKALEKKRLFVSRDRALAALYLLLV